MAGHTNLSRMAKVSDDGSNDLKIPLGEASQLAQYRPSALRATRDLIIGNS